MASTSAATVRHINKNLVTIAPAEGYSVVLFNLVDGNVEAIVTDGGEETIRLLIAGPGSGQTMSIKTHIDGVVFITYAEKASV